MVIQITWMFMYNGGYESIEAYLTQTRMAVYGIWGSDFEMSILAYRLNTIVYSYKADEYWSLLALTKAYQKMSIIGPCKSITQIIILMWSLQFREE